MRKTEIKFAWLGLLLWMAASPALAVIILPENVDWSKQPNWLEDVPVQETEPENQVYGFELYKKVIYYTDDYEGLYTLKSVNIE